MGLEEAADESFKKVKKILLGAGGNICNGAMPHQGNVPKELNALDEAMLSYLILAKRPRSGRQCCHVQ